MKQDLVQYSILGLLMDGKKSGYDLKNDFKNSVGSFYAPSFGSIYPILKKHEKNGYVIGKDEAVGKRKRTEYTITSLGKDTFLKWLKVPVAQHELQYSCDDILVKLYFYRYLPLKTRLALIKKLKDMSFENYYSLIECQKEISFPITDSRRWPLDWGVVSFYAYAKWLESIEDAYKKRGD
ncbi:MAG: PadR family transcriptional regulator [Spirochaetes bacterium]|nr:PadR family transcriptional regulator [Spirochaetota bacterium]MBN2771077.1 PadR family transcriptional regulator [Spirochaetota bacterium]